MTTWASHQNRLPRSKKDVFLSHTVTSFLNFHNLHYNDVFPYYEYFIEIECEKPSLETRAGEDDVYHYQNITFTKREASVLKYLLLGKTSKETSDLIHISAKTVEFHLANIKEKLGLKLRSELFQAAISYGYIHLMFDTRL